MFVKACCGGQHGEHCIHCDDTNTANDLMRGLLQTS